VSILYKIQKQPQDVVIFNECFKNFSFIIAVELIHLHILLLNFYGARSPQLVNCLLPVLGSTIRVQVIVDFQLLLLLLILLFSHHATHAPSEGFNQLLTLLSLAESFHELPLDCCLFFIFHHLKINLPLQLLDLIEVADQILLEVGLDVLSHSFNSVVGMINLANIKLILDEVGELNIVLLSIYYVSRAFAFFERPFKLRLEFVHLLPSHPEGVGFELLLSHLIESIPIVLAGNSGGILVPVRLI